MWLGMKSEIDDTLELLRDQQNRINDSGGFFKWLKESWPFNKVDKQLDRVDKQE